MEKCTHFVGLPHYSNSKLLIYKHAKIDIMTVSSLQTFEGSGGLFDFNATMPLMAIQFILLSIVLTTIFYEPVAQIIDERQAYIKDNFTKAFEKLVEADKLNEQLEEKLKTARADAKQILFQTREETNKNVFLELEKAKENASNLIEKTTQQLKDQEMQIPSNVKNEVTEIAGLIEVQLVSGRVPN